MAALSAFSNDEAKRAKLLLATQVASMMGRKLEEGDWSKVYCRAKGIPQAGWSNLHIDVIHNELGLEMKLLRITQLSRKPLKSVCGTTLMHPAATRSIRIDNTDLPADKVMRDVFAQYADLIRQRTQKVQESASGTRPDMRIGWLLWGIRLRSSYTLKNRWFRPIRGTFMLNGTQPQRVEPEKRARACGFTTRGQTRNGIR
jgi:hypothetical protein